MPKAILLRGFPCRQKIMKTSTNVYIRQNENPRAIFNTLLSTLFSSSSNVPRKNIKVTKELKITIAVEEKVKNERKNPAKRSARN